MFTNENCRILTTEQMSFCEKASEKYGVSLSGLMDNAGEKLAKHIISACKNKKEAVLLIGKGNNGGDGLVAANILKQNSIEPVIIFCCGMPATELSKNAAAKLSKDIKIYEQITDEALSEIENAQILVDCIFGTGFHGKLRENILPVFNACQKSKAYKIACDIPSGGNAENGDADKLTFNADITITFHREKLGLRLSPCRYFCGNIITEDIKIPNECEESLDFEITRLTEPQARKLLPKRTPYGHKGTFGKIISVCGSESYIGAAGISALSAIHTGVGLFELCTPKAVISSISSRILECTYSSMETDSQGFMTSGNAEKILEKCRKASCLLIGCGLGHTNETEKLVKELVENSPCSVVLDADGINSLCPNIDVLYKTKSQVILTPHPAELARLCGCEVSDILYDRLNFAKQLSKKYSVTVLAKGAETFSVSDPKAILTDKGNTALAKGGSGDMLAGITASFTAQGMNLQNAGALASFVMGKAAETASENCSERGLTASDIIKVIPYVLKKLES